MRNNAWLSVAFMLLLFCNLSFGETQDYGTFTHYHGDGSVKKYPVRQGKIDFDHNKMKDIGNGKFLFCPGLFNRTSLEVLCYGKSGKRMSPLNMENAIADQFSLFSVGEMWYDESIDSLVFHYAEGLSPAQKLIQPHTLSSNNQSNEDIMDYLSIGLSNIITGLILSFLLINSLVITRQKNYKHILLLGKYWKTTTPGLGWKFPLISYVDKTVPTNIQEIVVDLRLKTKDQVNFGLKLKVFLKIEEDVDKAYKASYDLEDYIEQIKTVATDSAIPVANGIDLEDVFDEKEAITDKVDTDLKGHFESYGIKITKVLSDEPLLPPEVEEAANAVISAKRKNEAAKYNAEAIKTEKIGEAKADGESVRIRTEEVAKARKDYATATAESVAVLSKVGCNPNDAMNYLSRIGDQDSVVTASRNGATTVFMQSAGNSNTSPNEASVVSAITALQALGEGKQTAS